MKDDICIYIYPLTYRLVEVEYWVYFYLFENMLPWTAKITPEKDESTILAEMFSDQLSHNEFFKRDYTSSCNTVSQIALMPYEIAHTSSYEPDDTYSDDSRLIQNELAYVRSNLDFEMNSHFTEFDRYEGMNKPGNGQQIVMPTIWTCVKNAFTMRPR